MTPLLRHAVISLILILPAIVSGGPAHGQPPSREIPARSLEAFKEEAIPDMQRQSTLIQQIIDQLFSYGELGFQEIETSRYLTKHGPLRNLS